MATVNRPTYCQGCEQPFAHPDYPLTHGAYCSRACYEDTHDLKPSRDWMLYWASVRHNQEQAEGESDDN